METTPPGKSTGREIVERAMEAALGSVPVAGAALAVTFVTALGWRLEERREKWFTELAGGVEELRQRMDGLSLESLARQRPVHRRRGDGYPDGRAHPPGREDRGAAQQGQHPSPATVMRMLRDHDEKVAAMADVNLTVR